MCYLIHFAGWTAICPFSACKVAIQKVVARPWSRADKDERMTGLRTQKAHRTANMTAFAAIRMPWETGGSPGLTSINTNVVNGEIILMRVKIA
ncbi:hypothetical protein, partial [Sphingomonas sp. LaA6.9]|uniref:hypothetical protein n=1 Tax=Sphingomonas sp. LaA6.9 TaxID=2919914 RepID=UPI001F5023BA